MPLETSNTAHNLPIRVYYEDTDAGGIVYYANHLKFFERARTEWLRDLGVSQTDLAQKHKQIFVVKKSEVEYRQPARHDDLLSIRSRIKQLGGASLTFVQQAILDDTVLCHCETVIVCVHSESMRPVKLHSDIRAILNKVLV